MIGDPVGALAATPHSDDPTALAIRGIALAQLDEPVAARRHLSAAFAEFSRRGDRLGAARTAAALAELSAAARDLEAARKDLRRAIAALDRAGDATNAAWSRVVLGRLETLRGDRKAAAALFTAATESAATPPLRIFGAIARAESALRRLEPTAARHHLAAARALAKDAPAVIGTELDRLEASLSRPVVRVGDRLLDPIAVERTLRDVLVVDGLRRRLRAGAELDLARRPILFSLLARLAEAHPRAATAAELIAAAFGVARPNESHRARLRVELGRLRKLLPRPLSLVADAGWRLDTRGAPITVLVPLVTSEHAAIDALLADGAAWSASDLAAILGASVRTIQRAILDRGESVRTVGRGRSRRYLARDASDLATQMLLLGLSAAR